MRLFVEFDSACGLPYYRLTCRGVAQPGRALGSGPRGRRFESSRPDQKHSAITKKGYSLRVVFSNATPKARRWVATIHVSDGKKQLCDVRIGESSLLVSFLLLLR